MACHLQQREAVACGVETGLIPLASRLGCVIAKDPGMASEKVEMVPHMTVTMLGVPLLVYRRKAVPSRLRLKDRSCLALAVPNLDHRRNGETHWTDGMAKQQLLRNASCGWVFAGGWATWKRIRLPGLKTNYPVQFIRKLDNASGKNLQAWVMSLEYLSRPDVSRACTKWKVWMSQHSNFHQTSSVIP